MDAPAPGGTPDSKKTPASLSGLKRNSSHREGRKPFTLAKIREGLRLSNTEGVFKHVTDFVNKFVLHKDIDTTRTHAARAEGVELTDIHDHLVGTWLTGSGA